MDSDSFTERADKTNGGNQSRHSSIDSPDSHEEEKKHGAEDGTEEVDVPSVPTVSDPSIPITLDESETVSEIKGEVVEEMAAQAMTLDIAYQSLEMVRKVNLQVEFGKEVDDHQCVSCLRVENSPNPVRSKVRKWMLSKAAPPCLACGSPVYKLHRSSDFGKQNIMICAECAHLFSMTYLTSRIMQDEDSTEKKKRLNYMLEVYDRALLVLMYSTQFFDNVVIALQGNTSRHNKIGLASSATGIVSGGLGVAAACTIFTPVGPPLFLASILFGGGARGEPNKMADRIFILHSIVSCIARLPIVMEMEEMREEEQQANSLKKDRRQSRLHLTRTAMTGLKHFTAGVLSAVSIVTEAREMKNTIDKIRAGNHCEKAERLAGIKDEVKTIPSTDDLSNRLLLIASRQQNKGTTKRPELETAANSQAI